MIGAGRRLVGVWLVLAAALIAGVPAADSTAPPGKAPEELWVARPFAGAVGPDGTTILLQKVYLEAPSGERTGTMGYLMYATDGRLFQQSLLARSVRHPRDGACVIPHPRGFLIQRFGKLSYDVLLHGGRHIVRRVWRRTE